MPKTKKTSTTAANNTKTLLFFDTETTGISGFDLPFQFSFVKVLLRGDEVVHEDPARNFFVDPGKTPNPQASAVHGYTNKDFIGKPKFGQVWGEIKALIDEADVLVAHNAQFDIRMMNAIIRQSCGNKSFDLKHHKDVFCTLQHAREYGDYSSNKLATIVNELGIQFIGHAHDAAGDTLSMLAVFKAWLKDGTLTGANIEVTKTKKPIPDEALKPTPFDPKQVCSEITGKPVLFAAPGAVDNGASNNNAAVNDASDKKLTSKKRARAS